MLVLYAVIFTIDINVTSIIENIAMRSWLSAYNCNQFSGATLSWTSLLQHAQLLCLIVLTFLEAASHCA